MAHLQLVPDEPPAWWAVLEAAAARPDVPRDVQIAALGALAYQAEMARQLEEIMRKAERFAACGW